MTATKISNPKFPASAASEAEWMRVAIRARNSCDKGLFFEAIDVLMNQCGVTPEHIATVFKKSERTAKRWRNKAKECSEYYQ